MRENFWNFNTVLHSRKIVFKYHQYLRSKIWILGPLNTSILQLLIPAFGIELNTGFLYQYWYMVCRCSPTPAFWKNIDLTEKSEFRFDNLIFFHYVCIFPFYALHSGLFETAGTNISFSKITWNFDSGVWFMGMNSFAFWSISSYIFKNLQILLQFCKRIAKKGFLQQPDSNSRVTAYGRVTKENNLR